MTQEEINKNVQNQIDELRELILDSGRRMNKYENNVLDMVFHKRNTSGTAHVITVGTAQVDISNAFDGYLVTKHKGKTADIPVIFRSE